MGLICKALNYQAEGGSSVQTGLEGGRISSSLIGNGGEV